MVQGKEQQCEFLRDNQHTERGPFLSVSSDEEENKGFVSHGRVLVHESGITLLHIIVLQAVAGYLSLGPSLSMKPSLMEMCREKRVILWACLSS